MTTKPAPTSHPKTQRAHLLGPILLVSALLATLFTAVQPGSLSVGDLSQQFRLMLTPRPAGADAVVVTSVPLRIGIVAGHYGNDSGAVCEDENGESTLTERDVNYEIATLVKDSLESMNFQVDLLQEFDTRLSGYNGAVLVSIHNDSCEYVNDQATGFKVAAATDTRDVNRATRLTACLVDRYQRVTNMIFHAGSITDDMTKYHTFSEVAPTTIAAIIETGFLNLDRTFLTQNTDKVAEGIVQGILCFINNENVEPTPLPSIPMSTNRDSRHVNDSILRALPRAGETSARVPSTPLRAGVPAVPKAEAKKKKSPGGLLVAVVIGGLFCVALTVVVMLVSSSPAVASMLQPAPQATSTRLSYFVQSDLRMPTLTPTPTVTPSPTATETPAYVEMSIVQDTATPERTYSYQSQSSSSYAGNKYILVDISEQHMYIYEGDALIWSWVASTGMNNATRTGVFAVQSKYPNAYGATWNIWMPNWLGIYWAGGLENGIHALPILPGGARLWAGFLGRPISYGCVVLSQYDSELLYYWAEIGTPVEIQW